MNGEQRSQFRYEYPLNVDTFKAKMKGGVSMDEALILLAAFATPFLILQSVTSLILGAVLAVVVFLCIRKYDRLGGASLPVYLVQRAGNAMGKKTITLTQIMPSVDASITVESYDGQTIAQYGDDA